MDAQIASNLSNDKDDPWHTAKIEIAQNRVPGGDSCLVSEIGVTQDGQNVWLVDLANGDRINIAFAAPGGEDGWGGISRVAATLKPGTYTFYSSVSGDSARGTLRVVR